jgi:hypothetical protein
MTLFSRKLAAVSLGAMLFGAGAIAVQAQTVAPPANPAPAPLTQTAALDPALQKMFMALATAMLANFAANASTGSLEQFDPAPMLESAVKGALSSRELNAALDRLVDQGMNANAAADSVTGGGTGTADSSLSPEMRALVRAALKGAVTMARTEIAREFASAAASTPAAAVPLSATPSSSTP